MRTVEVRLSRAEHRLLSDLAAAEGIDLEALIREALALVPLGRDALRPHLELVPKAGGREPHPRPAEPAMRSR